MRLVFDDFDSMTNCTRVDVFLDVFVHVESEILSFQQIQHTFMFEMSRVWIIMILFEKFSFEKFWKHISFILSAQQIIFNVSFEKRVEINFRANIIRQRYCVVTFLAFIFSLCVIDAFSTRNHTRCVSESNFCKIINTMWSFRDETMKIDCLFETFFIQSLNARSSLFATFSSRNCLEIRSMSRDDDLNDFFRFKVLLTIAMIFTFFWKIFAVEFNARVEFCFLFWKQLLVTRSHLLFAIWSRYDSELL